MILWRAGLPLGLPGAIRGRMRTHVPDARAVRKGNTLAEAGATHSLNSLWRLLGLEAERASIETRGHFPADGGIRSPASAGESCNYRAFTYSNAPRSSAPATGRGRPRAVAAYSHRGVRSKPVEERPGAAPAFTMERGVADVRR